MPKDIGIDLGTANILVHVKGKGIVMREPSVVAINRSGSILAFGNEAKDMVGRTPGTITAIRPVKDGVIADFTITQNMLKHYIQKSVMNKFFSRIRVVVCIPSGVTTVERRAVEEATLQAGAKETYLIEEPMAAAIGAGLAVEEPSGSMIVDIGGGTSEIAVISLGGIVVSNSLRVAGDKIDESIIHYIKREYSLMIGERTAENIKISIGSTYPSETEEKYRISGRDLVTGLPRSIEITSTEVMHIIGESVNSIVDAIKYTLEKTPPELASDIMVKGITVTGGGALLKGIDKLIAEETGIEVYIADSPLDCVALGTGKVLEGVDTLRNITISSKKKS